MGGSRVEIDPCRIKRSVFTPTMKSLVTGRRLRYGYMEEQGVTQEARDCSIKLRLRCGRESHCGIVFDPAKSELNDVPVQREACELRQGRVRRKDLHFPVAQVQIFAQPAQLQPHFDVLCRGLMIVVEQVEDQSPTVGFPSQLAQHVSARLQVKMRPSGHGFGACRNPWLRLSSPYDDAPTGDEGI